MVPSVSASRIVSGEYVARLDDIIRTRSGPVMPGPRDAKVMRGAVDASIAPGSLVGAYASGNEVHVLPDADKYTVAHELGHLVDWQHLSPGDRNYFQRLMHAPGGEWNRGTGTVNGMRSPSEWFADYYAHGATGTKAGTMTSYAQVGPKRLKRFVAAMDRVRKRQGLDPYRDL